MNKNGICVFIKKDMQMPFFTFIMLSLFSCNQSPQNTQEPTTIASQPYKKLGEIPLPKGYKRIVSNGTDFAFYSRNISLNKDNTVYLFNGIKKGNQTAQYAVLNIDIGNKDLQQCADAVMRLRAEYLFANKRYQDISFQFTNGFNCDFNHYANGYRVNITGNSCKWAKQTGQDYTHSALRKYLDVVYSYAGTKSLYSQMKSIPFSRMKPGHVLLQKREPYGHAVTIMDMAYNPATNDTIYLLSQSYMPAQSIHILQNPENTRLSPWYSIKDATVIETPEWTFTEGDLKAF